VNDTGIMTGHSLHGRAAAMAFLVYLAPIVAGVVLIVFMIKPLFARPARESKSRSLRREAAPLLFEFVDRICETVGAPRPKRIDVDCDVNASARFRRGLLSMFGRDLVLTIGMPLMAGLNTRQFAGVLAHEFGHFTQAFGMRLTYLIRSLSYWFVRVVYQRDRADEWLEHSARETDIRIGFILYLAMAFVWLSRRVLWVLMQVGHFFGSYLLRQMEFDADRHETRLAGSGAFEQTARQLNLLNVAAQGAYADLREFYREGRLGDDLPRLIVSRMAHITPEMKLSLDKEIATRKTGMFDTYPCDADRIVAAKREDTDGVYRVELPASVLLSDFEASSKAATYEFYRGVFGAELQKTQLRPVSEIVAKHERTREGESCLERFFGGEWSVLAPMTLGGLHLAPPSSAAEALAQLKAARQEMVAKIASVAGAAKALYEANGQTSQAQQYNCLLRSGIKIKKQLAEVGGPDGVKRLANTAMQATEQATSQLHGFNQLAAKRITLALQLLYVPKVMERMPEPKPNVREVTARYDALRGVADALKSAAEIHPRHSALRVLIDVLQSGGGSEDMEPVIQQLMDQQLPRAASVRNSLERQPYPYEHGKGKISLGQYLMPDVPLKGDLASVFNSCAQLLDQGPSLYVRLLGELVNLAENVEKVCGLAKHAPTEAATAAS
jgi:hypothetical protein